MKINKLIRINECDIIYDDKEFSFKRKTTKTYSTLLVAVLLTISYSLNLYTFWERGYSTILFILVPLLLLIVGYLLVTTIQLIRTKSIKNEWYSYKNIKSVWFSSDKSIAELSVIFNDERKIIVTTNNDRYLKQFIELLKGKDLEIRNNK